MKSTELQFFMVRLNPALWALPSVAIVGISVLKFDLFRNTWWIFVGVQLLLLVYLNMRFASYRKNVAGTFVDIPRPVSISYLLRLGLQPLMFVSLITISSSLLLLMLWRWNATTLQGWFWGMLVYGLWVFAFRIISAINTMYLVEDKGLWIYHGVDKIYIPYSKISNVQVLTNAKMDLLQIIYAGRIYVPGIRGHNFILLRVRFSDPIITKWFPEIYITPTNNLEFFNMLQKNI